MKFISTETKGAVEIIKLNRTDKFNSFNREMALELQSALDAAATDDNIRAIYFTAEGKAFCAGQDLGEAIDSSGPGIEKIVREHYNPIITRLRTIEKPIICGMNGVAAGAGANIVLACDVIVAAKSSAFIQAFSKIGLIPDSGGTFFLPRMIGFQRASALMMLGDKVMADDALQMGMLYKVVDDAALQEEGMKIAQTLAAMPTRGLWLTKKLLNESASNNLNQQLERELQEQVAATKTHDFKEGVMAFLEKRKPNFTGK
jgi:2-(1,2-epoxy-1,2-dihydrophenyl)acetyl-CoA isomerase